MGKVVLFLSSVEGGGVGAELKHFLEKASHLTEVLRTMMMKQD